MRAQLLPDVMKFPQLSLIPAGGCSAANDFGWTTAVHETGVGSVRVAFRGLL
jgi:hypothetical protein